MRLSQYIDCVDADVQYIENRPQYIVIASIYFQNVLKYIEQNIIERVRA